MVGQQQQRRGGEDSCSAAASNRSTITAVSTGTNATSWKSKMTASMTGSDKA